jgi:hypothetical protein
MSETNGSGADRRGRRKFSAADKPRIGLASLHGAFSVFWEAAVTLNRREEGTV